MGKDTSLNTAAEIIVTLDRSHLSYVIAIFDVIQSLSSW